MGLIALAADESAGGMGGSLVDLAVIAEALGTGNAVDPWLENGVLAAKLLSAGDAEQAADVLDGGTIAALAFAEPGGAVQSDAENHQGESGRRGFYPVGREELRDWRCDGRSF